jgi:cell division protein FtsB
VTDRDRLRRRRESPSAAPARNGRNRRTGDDTRRSRTSSASTPAPAAAAKSAKSATAVLDDEPRPEDERAPRAPSAGRVLGARVLRRLTTRRAALLALVVCALALSVAVPMRTYLSQRAQLEQQLQLQQSLKAQQSQLEHQQQELSDPAQAEAQIRERLRYVRPGQTPYVVQLPPGGGNPVPSGATPAAPAGTTGAPGTGQPWYQNLWNSVEGQH